MKGGDIMNTTTRNGIVAYYKSDNESLVGGLEMNYIATPTGFLHPVSWGMMDVYKCIRSICPTYSRLEVLKFAWELSRMKKQPH